MWQLNPSISFEWFADSGEYLLYSPEVSETILLNEIAYNILQQMMLNPQRQLTGTGIKEILSKNLMIISAVELESQIEGLMDVLLKKYMVRQINN